MIFPKAKTRYREVIGVLAFFSALGAADCYFSPRLFAHYFPNRSHRTDDILAIVFSALFLALTLELFSLYIFKRRAKEPDDKSA